MSIAHNQLRIARELWARLQPLDRGVPARLQTLLADRRFGSRDRRLYRELLFTALRQARALAPLDPDNWAAHLVATCAPTPETEPLRAAYPGPPPPLPEPLSLLPSWFSEGCETGRPPAESAAALLARAPVWIRFQTTDPRPAREEWAARGWSATPHPLLPDAWRLAPETPVSGTRAYQEGHYEIQDLGSQAILAALDLPARSPGPRWLDACAGAGGKTLQLARLLGPAARIDATDIRPSALRELRARGARAGLAPLIRVLDGPAGPATYDAVLVDAPCSGSGTWRRSPHLLHCTGPDDLAAAACEQTQILRSAAPLVRRGGWLVYATCSIARAENRAVAEHFLAAQDGRFVPEAPPLDLGFPRIGPSEAGLALSPGLQDNDGFYFALFRRVGAED